MPAVPEWTGLPDSRSAPVGLRALLMKTTWNGASQKGEGSKTSRVRWVGSDRPAIESLGHQCPTPSQVTKMTQTLPTDMDIYKFILFRSVFDASILTKQLIIDAKKLQEAGFYKNAILSYSHYLEQMLLTAVGSKYKDKPDEVQKFFTKILKIKDFERLNFGKIMKIVGDEIPISSIANQCDEVRKIRNSLAAHHFSTVGIGYSSSARDVNDYKKIIRRMYKFIKQEQEIADVEYFLYQSPLLIRAKLPERVIENRI